MQINTALKICLGCTALKRKLNDLLIKVNNILNNCFLKMIASISRYSHRGTYTELSAMV